MLINEELHKIINQIPLEKQIIAKSFLEWLKSQNHIQPVKERISLQGITDGSTITERDIEEVKAIWRLQ